MTPDWPSLDFLSFPEYMPASLSLDLPDTSAVRRFSRGQRSVSHWRLVESSSSCSCHCLDWRSVFAWQPCQLKDRRDVVEKRLQLGLSHFMNKSELASGGNRTKLCVTANSVVSQSICGAKQNGLAFRRAKCPTKALGKHGDSAHQGDH